VVVTVVVGSVSRVTVIQPVRQSETPTEIKRCSRTWELVCFILSKLPLNFVLESIGGRHKRVTAAFLSLLDPASPVV
jgi:hypothetical protein